MKIRKTVLFFLVLTAFGTTLLAQKTDSPEVIEFNKAYDLYEAKKYKEALPIFEKYAPTIFKTLAIDNNVEGILNFATVLQTCYSNTNSKPSSSDIAAMLTEVEKIRAQLGQTVQGNWYSLMQKGKQQQQQLQFKEALQTFQEALAAAEKEFGKDHENYGIAANDLATAYEDLQRYSEAEPLYLLSLKILKKRLGAESATYGSALNNVGAFYEKTDRPRRAEPLYEESLYITEKTLGSNSIDYAKTLANLAGIYRKQGKYEKAEDMLRTALALKIETYGNTHPETAKSMGGLALLYEDMSRYSESVHFFETSIKILNKSKDDNPTLYTSYQPVLAMQLNNLANEYETIGNYVKADSLYQLSLKLHEKIYGKDHSEYNTVLGNYAGLLAKKGDVSAAEKIYPQILDNLYKNNMMIDYNTLKINVATMYSDKKQYDKAEKILLESIDYLNKNYGKQNREYRSAVYNLARLYEKSGRMDKAEIQYKIVVKELLESFEKGSSSLSEEERESFVRLNNFYFINFQRFALRKSGYLNSLSSDSPKEILGDLLNVQLATKGMLANNLQKIRKRIIASNDEYLKSVFVMWQDTRDRIAQAQNLSVQEQIKKGLKIDSLQYQANAYEKELSKISSDFAENFIPKNIKWQDLQKNLKPNEIMVEVLRMPHNADTVIYAALILTSETKKGPELAIFYNGKAMEKSNASFFTNNVKFKMEDNLSYNVYWKPIQEKILKVISAQADQGKLICYFSPDGIYNTISMNTLQDPASQKYLLDNMQVQQVTNLKEIEDRRVQPVIKGDNRFAILMGRPSYEINTPSSVGQNTRSIEPDENTEVAEKTSARASAFKNKLTDLKGTEKEIQNIGQTFQEAKIPAKIYLHDKANEETIKGMTSPYVLHVATHGFFMPQENTNILLQSGIMLAGVTSYYNLKNKPNTEDGVLTAFEAMNLPLDNTELTVLSACETGLGEVKEGEGVYGLQRAIRVAGARSVVMSLWKVDDAATEFLMTNFYRLWLIEKLPKLDAFRQSQMKVRERYPHPYYWGAFVMVGY